MIALQVVTLAAVVVTGTAVVIVREPARQAIVAGIFGLALALLFFVYAAPDVALSQIVVSSVAVPVVVLLTMAKLREEDDDS